MLPFECRATTFDRSNRSLERSKETLDVGRPELGTNSGFRWLRHVPHRIDHPVSLLLVFISRLADFQFGLDHPRTQLALHRLVTLLL